MNKDNLQCNLNLSKLLKFVIFNIFYNCIEGTDGKNVNKPLKIPIFTSADYVTVGKDKKKNRQDAVALEMCRGIWEVTLYDKKTTRNTLYALRHTCDVV